MRAPLARASAGMPSPPSHGRRSEWPSASTDAATGGDGGTASLATGAAWTGARSGTSAAALLPPPARARMRGQKAGAGGNPSAARLSRTWCRRIAVMLQCLCALRRTTSAGSPLKSSPLRVSLVVASAAVPVTRVVGARGPLLGGAFPLVARSVRVRPIIHFNGVDERGRARRAGPIGGSCRRQGCDRRSHAQRQGRRRCGSPPVSMRRDGLEQRASVAPHRKGLGGALPHPVPQVATERAGPPPPRRGPRLGRAALCATAR